MKVQLRYCSVWNYEPRAVGLTAKLLETYKQRISSFELIPASGGCFELKAGDELLYSKLETGLFPTDDEAIAAVGQQLKQAAGAR